MKRFYFVLIIAVLSVGTVFAQSQADRSSAPAQADRDSAQKRPERASPENRPERKAPQKQAERRPAPDPVTIDGTLKLEKGSVAVASGDNVYIIPMLTRYIGFIDGLKEGARVSVEGFSFRNFLHPSKVTIDGKSYDFAMGAPGRMGAGGRNDFDRGRGGFAPGGRSGSDRNRGDLRPSRTKFNGRSGYCPNCTSRGRKGRANSGRDHGRNRR